MLVVAVVLTVLAVAWTGWRALRDLEVLEHRLDLEPYPVVRRPRLRLVDPSPLTTS